MIVKLNPLMRPPFERGELTLENRFIEFDERLGEIYKDIPWDVYYDFSEEELYIVLAISGSDYLRLSGGSIFNTPYKYSISPFLYPLEMFDIVNEDIPEDWMVLISEGESTLANSLDIYTYSDLNNFKANLKNQKLYTFPKSFGISGFSLLAEKDEKILGELLPKLHEFVLKQVEINLKRKNITDEIFNLIMNLEAAYLKKYFENIVLTMEKRSRRKRKKTS